MFLINVEGHFSCLFHEVSEVYCNFIIAWAINFVLLDNLGRFPLYISTLEYHKKSYRMSFFLLEKEKLAAACYDSYKNYHSSYPHTFLSPPL